MALLVPVIGEIESLRYLVGANNHVATIAETNPRNLILKLFSSNTAIADSNVPSATYNTRGDFYEPYNATGTVGYGTTATTGYPLCVNNRTDQNYTSNYGILLNGSRWTYALSGTGSTVVTFTYPEQTFTFTGTAGNIYGYYLTRATNLPILVHGVVDAATVGVGTVISKGSAANATIGVLGNSYIDIAPALSVDDVTVGMGVTHIALVGNPIGIKTGTTVVGVDRALKRVYLSNPVEQNIQVATGATCNFSFSKVSVKAGSASTHGLSAGDVLYIARGTSNTTTTENVYTVHTVYNANEFTTTPALDGTGNATLYSSIFYAERFTNGPYAIQNNGDQIKVTLNVSLE
jgi:hypothetical protein